MLSNSLNAASTRIIPIKRPNQAKTVTKLADGGLRVELYSGQTFTIHKGDEIFMAFVVWTMVNSECREVA